MLVMPRTRTTKKVLIGFRINSKLLDRLDELSESLGRNRSDLLDRAVETFLDMADTDTRTVTPPAKPAKPTRP